MQLGQLLVTSTIFSRLLNSFSVKELNRNEFFGGNGFLINVSLE